jgi:1-acyl-sn-glycerol-3-phosphate acyltransferase
VDDSAASWDSHRALKLLVDSVARVTYSDVDAEVHGDTAEGPVLIVANHFGGAADAIVIMSVLSRRPRILADESIWKVPVAKQVMEWLGAIPVRRRKGNRTSGGSGGADNSEMFSECHAALAQDEAVLIFPEGVTREEPSIGEVRSGAARIALGAHASGVRGLKVVPVGIHYDDKAAFRSSVFVNVGAPIDVDAVVDSLAGRSPDADDVGALTDVIAERLREAAPDYDDWQQARSLLTASEVFLRSLEPTKPVPVGLRDRLASWLQREGADEVVEGGGRYRSLLHHAGVRDSWVRPGGIGFSRAAVLALLVFFLMLPYAAIGVVMHGIPVALTWLTTRLPIGAAVRATLMPLAALVFFGATGIFWIVQGAMWRDLEGALAALALYPVTFVALVAVSERLTLWVRGFRNRIFPRRSERRTLGAERDELASAVGDLVLRELGNTGNGVAP